MMPLLKPCSIYALGSTIDVLMKAGFLPFRNLSRSGPTVPLAPASLSVWQAAQPLAANTCLPAATLAAPPGPPPPAGGPPPARRAGAGARGLLGEPAVEVCDRHDVRRLAHEGVAEPAELGADDRIGLGLARHDGRDPVVRRDPRHGVDLHPPGRDPEVVQHVQRDDVELHRLALGHEELRRLELLAAGRPVLEGPGELAADDADLHLAAGALRRGLLDVVQHDV